VAADWGVPHWLCRQVPERVWIPGSDRRRHREHGGSDLRPARLERLAGAARSHHVLDVRLHAQRQRSHRRIRHVTRELSNRCPGESCGGFPPGREAGARSGVSRNHAAGAPHGGLALASDGYMARSLEGERDPRIATYRHAGVGAAADASLVQRAGHVGQACLDGRSAAPHNGRHRRAHEEAPEPAGVHAGGR
jgi:hypothetical protein